MADTFDANLVMDGTEIELNELDRTGSYRSSDDKLLDLKEETVRNGKVISYRRGMGAIAGNVVRNGCLNWL